jgi:arginase family enzyme
LPKEIRIRVPTSDELAEAVKKIGEQLGGLVKVEVVEENPTEKKPETRPSDTATDKSVTW